MQRFIFFVKSCEICVFDDFYTETIVKGVLKYEVLQIFGSFFVWVDFLMMDICDILRFVLF